MGIDFEKNINVFLRNAGNNFPPSAGKLVYEHQAKIKKILAEDKFNSVSDVKKRFKKISIIFVNN